MAKVKLSVWTQLLLIFGFLVCWLGSEILYDFSTPGTIKESVFLIIAIFWIVVVWLVRRKLIRRRTDFTAATGVAMAQVMNESPFDDISMD